MEYLPESLLNLYRKGYDLVYINGRPFQRTIDANGDIEIVGVMHPQSAHLYLPRVIANEVKPAKLKPEKLERKSLLEILTGKKTRLRKPLNW